MAERDEQPRRGRIDKRSAVVDAARRVFGKDGYARATIEAIAAEAAVSTRTVYNHFDGKEELFLQVISESSTQVADAIIEVIDRELDDVTELEAGLVALGRAWVGLGARFPDHVAMTRQVGIEAHHLPTQLLDAWNQAGPRRAERSLARHLELLGHRGLLAVDDPRLAAEHFILLTVGAVGHRRDGGAVDLDQAELAEIIAAGVRVFVNGYRP